MIRLWKHECARVFGDRLTTPQEFKRFMDMLVDCTKKHFEDFDQDIIHSMAKVILLYEISRYADSTNNYS